MTSYLTHLVTDLTFVCSALCIPGLIAAVRLWPNNKAPGLFIFMSTAYACFFSWRANLDMNNPLLKGVVERFWMQSDIVVVVIAGFGLDAAVKFITKSHTSKYAGYWRKFALLLAVVVTAAQLKNFQLCDQSANYVVRDFAKSLMNSMPKNALVLTKGDLPTNSMRYLHLCENMRRDLDILDVEIMR